ncbi:hypothetical protein DAI22_06g203603 [Oryza sativa Japonica Group]|nr:hypothetical protein DAI22_06g203603 [Oryza sativa Japonica Group]
MRPCLHRVPWLTPYYMSDSGIINRTSYVLNPQTSRKRLEDMEVLASTHHNADGSVVMDV